MYKKYMEERECRYCKSTFVARSKNAMHCSQDCYNFAKRSRKYNITYLEHQMLRSETHCQICKSELDTYLYNEKKRPDKSKRCIDHDHITGKVRGVLCDGCNVGLGAFRDNLQFLKNAVTYLKSDPIERKIVELFKDAYSRGWISAKDGNMTALMGDILYITPSGVRKHELQASDILQIKIVNGVPEIGNKVVSGEFKMHWLLQEVQPGCVVHLHPTHVIAAMEKGWNLPDIADMLQELSRFTKVGHNVRKLPVTSDILAKETFSAMTDNGKIIYDIVGQAGHGVTAYGKSLDEAFEHVERLNHACEIILLSGVSPK